MKQTQYAGVELDTNHKLNEAEIPCMFSFRYQSVIGEGPVHMAEVSEEKNGFTVDYGTLLP